MKKALAESFCMMSGSSEMNQADFQIILNELPPGHRDAIVQEAVRTGQSVGALLKAAILEAAARFADSPPADPLADANLAKRKVVRAKDHPPGKGRAA